MFLALPISALLLLLLSPQLAAASGGAAANRGQAEGRAAANRGQAEGRAAANRGQAEGRAAANRGQAEGRLLRRLLARYDPRVRPVSDYSTPVRVSMYMELLTANVADGDQLELLCYLSLSWQDDFLRWDKDAEGVRKLVIPAGSVWRPDISMLNPAKLPQLQTINSELPDVVAFPSGAMLQVLPLRLWTNCARESRDSVDCFAVFGAWSHDGWEVDVNTTSYSAGLAEYNTNPRWSILDASASRREMHYPCCEEPYPSVRYRFRLAPRTSAANSEEEAEQGA